MQDAEANLVDRLIHAARACRAGRSAFLQDLGLVAGQDNLLQALARRDGQSMRDLAAGLAVRSPTVSKMVTRMIAQGTLRREVSKADARSSLVFLTEKGAGLIAEIETRRRQADSIAFARLKEKDEKRLRKILERILADYQQRLADSG